MPTDPNAQVWGDPPNLRFHGEDIEIALLGAAGVDPTGWTLLATVCEEPGDDPVFTVVPTVSGPSSGKYTITVGLTRAQTGTTMTEAEYYLDVWRTDSGSNKRLAGGVLRLSTPERELP